MGDDHLPRSTARTPVGLDFEGLGEVAHNLQEDGPDLPALVVVYLPAGPSPAHSGPSATSRSADPTAAGYMTPHRRRGGRSGGWVRGS